ncbi:MAG: tRNA (adenosine(37)-N6)-threonylcarbamoyltransferase complex ATPase subunit type 1 TsaE [Bifidobacteriaceae bacterium]|jgi:tRNA threonylcarbamoyladenosine biosynthesis protein TsaE|nr:tRNA (adenosine(37)-N6)-threonylcarbamoyltransferase complex ATPase subunit type 1 TsaE [Bifidobacteriaceae bacterium]
MKNIQKINNLSQLDIFTQKLIKHLHIGDIIVLSGPLGVGKTAFTKSLAKALGIEKMVVSPTFTLERIYKIPGKLKGKSKETFLVHIDAYRLSGNSSPNGAAGHLLYDQLQSLDIDSFLNNSLVVIEWGELVENLLNSQELTKNIIHINISFATDDLSNSLRIFEIFGLDCYEI